MERRRHRTGPDPDEVPRRRRTGLVRDDQTDLVRPVVDGADQPRHPYPQNNEGKEENSLPPSTYTAPPGLRQGPGRGAQSSAERKNRHTMGEGMFDVIIAGGGPTGMMLA